MKLTIGEVQLFDERRADKAQAVKVLEEAAEVFGAWQEMNAERGGALARVNSMILLEECADVIQAVSNLAGAVLEEMGGSGKDFEGCMCECTARNIDRGRITEVDR